VIKDFTEGKDLKNMASIIGPIKDYYFEAKLLSWDRDQLYPDVEIIKKVGLTGDIEIEC